MVALVLLYIYVGIFGSFFWTQPLTSSIPSLTILQLFRYGMVFFGAIGILQSIYKVIVFQGENKRPLHEILTPWVSMLGAIAIFAVFSRFEQNNFQTHFFF